MDVVRVGLSLRALRRKRGWTQVELARSAHVSRALISKVETGGVGSLTLDAVASLAATLGARFEPRIAWHGEGLDRLLDQEHATIVDEMVARLRALGWEVWVEATFQARGERGSIDILAFHPATRTLLVIEVKSVVPDFQAMLASLDRKARLAPDLAPGRGWHASTVARLLVLPADRTSRRRLATFDATMAATLPARTRGVLRWLADPTGSLAGVLLLASPGGRGPVAPRRGRHRIRRIAGAPTTVPAPPLPVR